MRHPMLLPVQLRPRERLLRCGAQALSEEELWMCVLGAGSSRQRLPQMVRWWSHMLQLSQWQQSDVVRALGQAQASRLLAVRELQVRYQTALRARITCVQDILQLVAPLASRRREELWVLYCSVQAEVLHQECLAVGGLNVVNIWPRDILRPIARHPVDSLVLCHNHPSGNCQPSGEDVIFTRRIAAACQILGLTLRDHVIVTRSGYYSFAERGALGSSSTGCATG